MGIVVGMILSVILFLIIRKYFYFIQEKNYGLSKAFGAALVAWIIDVPYIIKNIIQGIIEGFKFIVEQFSQFKSSKKGDQNG